MFKRLHVPLLGPALLLITSAGMSAEILVEAESFDDHGGWVLDPQFLDVMGSPYLMAHGLGKPVKNAATEIELPESGTYTAWVRTKDWAPKWSPGRFKLVVDGKELRPTFGTSEENWAWHCGGTIEFERDPSAIGTPRPDRFRRALRRHSLHDRAELRSAERAEPDHGGVAQAAPWIARGPAVGRPVRRGCGWRRSSRLRGRSSARPDWDAGSP